MADVRDLPVLRKLDLSGNQVEDVASLTALPELRDMNLTDTLVRALPEPKPANWQLKMAEAPAAPAGPHDDPGRRRAQGAQGDQAGRTKRPGCGGRRRLAGGRP